MSHTSMILGDSWRRGEYPEYVVVAHGADDPTRRYVPERTCRMEERDQDGYEVPESLCGDGFCSQCWGIIEVEDKFCRRCGARMEE